MDQKNIFSRNANKIPIFFFQLYDIGFWMKNQVSKRYPLSLSSDYNPFFIIGSPRSGTTLLRSILVTNTSIAIPPESYVLYKLFRKYLTYQHLGWEDLSRLIISELESKKQFTRWNTNLYPCYQEAFRLPKKDRSLAKIIEIIYKQYIRDNNPTAVMWGDKTPYNTLYLNWIHKLYPRAKYVHMLRDGRDAVSSQINNLNNTNIEYACWRWKTSIEMAQKLGGKVGKNSFLEIRYESLVHDTKSEVEQICTFLGIQFSLNMLNPQLTAEKRMKTTVAFPHHKNLLNSINNNSIGKWERELNQSQKTLLYKLIEKKLRQLNYI